MNNTVSAILFLRFQVAWVICEPDTNRRNLRTQLVGIDPNNTLSQLRNQKILPFKKGRIIVHSIMMKSEVDCTLYNLGKPFVNRPFTCISHAYSCSSFYHRVCDRCPSLANSRKWKFRNQGNKKFKYHRIHHNIIQGSRGIFFFFFKKNQWNRKCTIPSMYDGYRGMGLSSFLWFRKNSVASFMDQTFIYHDFDTKQVKILQTGRSQKLEGGIMVRQSVF